MIIEPATRSPGDLRSPVDLSATADPEVAAVWSPMAQVDRMAAVELAWLMAGTLTGEVDPDVANRLAEVITGGLDVDSITTAVTRDATPVIELVSQLRQGMPASERAVVHAGLTSQDVIDNAAMLGMRTSLDRLGDLVTMAGDACAALAQRHRDTPMMARTLLQQAVPSTFGLRAAHWLSGLTRDRQRLVRARDMVALSWGGAAGTASGQSSQRVVSWGDHLDLPVPELPWHGDRDRIHELAGLVATVAGQAASRGRDLVALAQTEVAEVVPTSPGRSSAIPDKSNPAAAVLSLSAARVAAGAAAGLLHATEVELDRAAGAWQAEWALLPTLLAATAAALAHGLRALEDVRVDVDLMASRVPPDPDLGRAGELVDAAVTAWRE